MAHVFISYVHENNDAVNRLAEVLRAFQIEVWLDKDSISPGQRWKDAIRAAIQEGAYFLACFSVEYEARTKTHMNEELLLAIEEIRLRPADRAWFIPIRLNEAAVPKRSIGPGETLADIQAISLFPKWEEGVRRLLAVIQPTSGVIYELTNSLTSLSARIRISAADELAKLGPLAESAAPELRRLLADDNETVRAAAASALGKLGVCDTALVIDLLRIAGDDGHPDYPRKHASQALVAIGEKAVSCLLQVAAGDDQDMAEAAHATIVAIGEKSLPALYRALEQDEPSKMVAIRALGSIPQTQPATADDSLQKVEGLLSALGKANEDERPDVIRALGSLRHRAAVEPLIEQLRDQNYICVVAASALQEIGDVRAIQPLIDVLADPRRFWVPRGAAAVALGHFGPNAAIALPALQEALSYDLRGETWDERAHEAVVDAIAHLRDPNAQCTLRGRGYRYEMWGLY